MFRPPMLVGLVTDFGHHDPYVGQMKAALVRDAPNAALIDLCHDVPPFDLTRAAFFAAASSGHFPSGSLLIVVVDPGVGSSRRIVLLVKEERFHLAPDNGVLTLILDRPGRARCFDVTPRNLDQRVAPTFHGRDVIAPLAACIARGEPPESLGPEIAPDSLVRLAHPGPQIEGATLTLTVLHVDGFGNIVLNAEGLPWSEAIRAAAPISLVQPTQAELKPVRVYADLAPGELGLLMGSQGFVEIAANQASAGESIGAKVGGTITLNLSRPLRF